MWTAGLHQPNSTKHKPAFVSLPRSFLFACLFISHCIHQSGHLEFSFIIIFFYQKVYALQIKWGLFIIDDVLTVAVSESKMWVLPLCCIVLCGWRGRFERKISDGLIKSHTGARISATLSIKTIVLEQAKELVFQSQKKDWIAFMWSNFQNNHRHFLSLWGLPSINPNL